MKALKIDQPRRARRPRNIPDPFRVFRRFRGLVATLAALCVLGGTSSFVSVVAQVTVDRSKPPQIGPPPALKLPPLVTRTLPNGLRVWLFETREVPLVQVNLLVQAGSGDDPQGQFGVANLTAAMLDEGAGTRTALEVSDALEFLGASLNTGSSFDRSEERRVGKECRL